MHNCAIGREEQKSSARGQNGATGRALQAECEYMVEVSCGKLSGSS
jgi:hypothetical protein